MDGLKNKKTIIGVVIVIAYILFYQMPVSPFYSVDSVLAQENINIVKKTYKKTISINQGKIKPLQPTQIIIKQPEIITPTEAITSVSAQLTKTPTPSPNKPPRTGIVDFLPGVIVVSFICIAAAFIL
jgi:hypothetical protein